MLTRAYGLHDARVAFALHNLGGFYLSQVSRWGDGSVAFGCRMRTHVSLLHGRAPWAGCACFSWEQPVCV